MAFQGWGFLSVQYVTLISMSSWSWICILVSEVVFKVGLHCSVRPYLGTLHLAEFLILCPLEWPCKHIEKPNQSKTQITPKPFWCPRQSYHNVKGGGCYTVSLDPHSLKVEALSLTSLYMPRHLSGQDSQLRAMAFWWESRYFRAKLWESLSLSLPVPHASSFLSWHFHLSDRAPCPPHQSSLASSYLFVIKRQGNHPRIFV